MNARVLVVAKAPLTGQVKTRLGAEIGLAQAAEVAAASLLDTIAACSATYGAAACHLALAGDLATATRGRELLDALSAWTVFAQRGDGFAERLVHAHHDVAARGDGPVVQIGMDTPQVTPRLLRDAVAALDQADAVLGPAEDGGWWVLTLSDARAAAPLRDVEMSSPTTYDDTRRALEQSGLRVATTAQLRDVDTLSDAVAVAAEAPGGAFAQAWGPIHLAL